MKAVASVRKVDELGRVVLPRELRDYLDLKSHDVVAVSEHDNAIILQKYFPAESEHTENMRKIDELGRVHLPKEIRTRLFVEPRDSLTIRLGSDGLILEKHISAA